jgi:hypothetical protein
MFWSVGWPLLRAEGFFYNLDILYGGLGIGKLQVLIKKKKKNSAVIFFQFLVIKALDLYWIRICIGSTSNSGSGSGKKWIRIHNPASGLKLNIERNIVNLLLLLQGNVRSLLRTEPQGYKDHLLRWLWPEICKQTIGRNSLPQVPTMHHKLLIFLKRIVCSKLFWISFFF